MELFRLVRLLTCGKSGKIGVMEPVLDAGAVAGKPKKKLLDETRDVMRLKHYSLRTERTYCDWITRFIRFHRMPSPGRDERTGNGRAVGRQLPCDLALSIFCEFGGDLTTNATLIVHERRDFLFSSYCRAAYFRRAWSRR
jgi:Phage integrase, N-terminal SAM-like domain